MAYLAEIGRGYEHRGARVPIVPGASLFDLLNGGEKDWGRKPPYWDMGHKAASIAAVCSRSEPPGRASARRPTISKAASARQAL